MPLDMLVEEAKGMSDEALLEVVHFMKFLKFSPPQTDDTQSKEKKVYRSNGVRPRCEVREDEEISLVNNHDKNH